MNIMHVLKKWFGPRGEATLPPSPATETSPKKAIQAEVKRAIENAEMTCEVHDRNSGVFVPTGAGKAMLLLVALFLAACAAPASDQGQGGSTGATPLVVVNIGTGGGVEVSQTSAPTAAPASSASAAQTATNDVRPAVGTDAIKAAVPGAGAAEGVVKVLGGDGTVKPEPKPGE